MPQGGPPHLLVGGLELLLCFPVLLPGYQLLVSSVIGCPGHGGHAALGCQCTHNKKLSTTVCADEDGESYLNPYVVHRPITPLNNAGPVVICYI